MSRCHNLLPETQGEGDKEGENSKLSWVMDGRKKGWDLVKSTLFSVFSLRIPYSFIV